MDQLDEPIFFLINVILVLIYAIIFFGIDALIAFGLIAAPLLLITLIAIFIAAGVSST